MCETVKVHRCLHCFIIFTFLLGRVLPDQPPVSSDVDIAGKSRAKNAGSNLPELKPNAKINLIINVQKIERKTGFSHTVLVRHSITGR